jgi:hypothetical protein
MRFFTRGWASGDLPEEEADLVPDRYQDHLRQIEDQLPAAVLDAASKLELHDALIERIDWFSHLDKLEITLITRADRGLGQLTICYDGVQLGESSVRQLEDLARDRRTEVLYDEFDVDDGERFAHRILFWPRDELTIRFQSLSFVQTDREDARLMLTPYFLSHDDDT